ncbi:hypothetical protein ZOSMA_218G00080 [Zostera marina]|uniref:Uncharacterized protein n=1 Tax=Zostera marina TaxID=29655 RepID=A0A0K9PK09_ZOSMR|nr:hypothetical protein ZOSMA_218G00080 [Zostera marina]
MSMQLEDIDGARGNGKHTLLVLKQGLSCHRSRNYDEILKSCQMYFKAQIEHKQEKIEQEIQLDRLCILCVECLKSEYPIRLGKLYSTTSSKINF